MALATLAGGCLGANDPGRDETESSAQAVTFCQDQLCVESEAPYTFRARSSNKVIRVDGANPYGNGSSITQWDLDYNWDKYEPFRIWKVNDAGPEVVIESFYTGKVLDVEGFSKDNGARVQTYDWNGTPNQMWRILPTGDGSFVVANANSGKVLDVAGQSMDNGAPTQQWDYWGGDNQRWTVAAFPTNPGFGETYSSSYHSAGCDEYHCSNCSQTECSTLNGWCKWQSFGVPTEGMCF